MESNFTQITAPGTRILSDGQISKIYSAILRILEIQGSIVNSDEARELLLSNGAWESEDKLIHIPASMVKAAVDSVPKSFTLYDRDGNEAMVVEGYNSFFGIAGDTPDFFDVHTGERRPYVTSDYYDVAKIMDYLPHLQFYHLVGAASDLDPYVAYRECGYATMPNTRACAVLCMGNKDAAAELIEVAQAIAGGPEELRKKPNLFSMSEPITPLKHDPDSLARLMICAEAGVPAVYYGMPMQGATAPASAAGTIILGAAESLTGLVIHQLKCKGSPFVFGAIPAVMDMHTMSYTYGGPELTKNLMGLINLAHYLEIPCWGTTMSDSNSIDAQCGAEFAISLFANILSGANLIHDCGMMDSAEITSLESIVFQDELIDLFRVIQEGIPCDDDNLAVDAIADVGAGGSFLSHKHTRARVKQFWNPKVFDRSTDYTLTKTFNERLTDKAQWILENHEVPPLPEEKLQAIEAVRQKWEAKRAAEK
jgi:trimethylamine--corrinoid protein Co-methyltransferase